MRKADGTSIESINVYERGKSVYLVRYFPKGNSYRHLVHPAARGWIEEAALVWDDLIAQGSSFRSVGLGYPENKNA